METQPYYRALMRNMMLIVILVSFAPLLYHQTRREENGFWGLSISYGIIKKMGGDITLNSSAGLGTIFHVHLPAPESENPIQQ